MRRSALVALCLMSPGLAQALPGSGTALDPYRVGSCADLDDVRDDMTADYRLTSDIDCDVAPYDQGFAPIGSIGNAFTGDLDGAGFEIRGLTIDSGLTGCGLIGATNGSTITDLSLVEASVQCGTATGALVGQAENTQLSAIQVNATVTGNEIVGGVVGVMVPATLFDVYMSGSVQGQSRVGGIAGEATLGSVIERCTVQASILGAPTGPRVNIGGVVGQAHTLTIRECSSQGGIQGGGFQRAGGIVGSLVNGTIEDTRHYNVVQGQEQVGGIVGEVQGVVTIRRVYAAAGWSAPGGLVAGVVALNSGNLTLQNSWVVPTIAPPAGFSSVSAGTSTGGNSWTVSNFYYDDVSGGVPCYPGSYSGCVYTEGDPSPYYIANNPPMESWDFTNVWQTTGTSFPSLRRSPVAGFTLDTCPFGDPYDWDDNGSDDGCRGDNVVIADGAVVGAGSYVGDDAVIGAGAQLGDDARVQAGVIIGARAVVGARAALGLNAVVGRRAVVGDDVDLGEDTVVGRAATVGNDVTVGGGSSLGYGSTVGDGVNVGDLVLGSLAQLGGTGAALDAVDCTGPLIIARGAQVATEAPFAFTCTGQVVVGPDAVVGSGADFAGNIRIRKSAQIGDGGARRSRRARWRHRGRRHTAGQRCSRRPDPRVSARQSGRIGRRAWGFARLSVVG